MLRSEVWAEKIAPAFIFFFLWLDGWFLPIILLPIVYVLFVEKKSLSWLGFSRHEILISLVIGVLIASVLTGSYCPIFLYYLPMAKTEVISLHSILWDVAWYPIYEEVTYRSFALSHFAKLDKSFLSSRNLTVNIFQSLAFVAVHKHHFNVPLVLLPVFFLGLVNGFLFLKTRNIFGCIVSHSALNGFALLIEYVAQTSI